MCTRGPKLSNFKIGGLKLQNGENRGTKTATNYKLFVNFAAHYSIAQ
jgi:hypothetical protein